MALNQSFLANRSKILGINTSKTVSGTKPVVKQVTSPSFEQRRQQIIKLSKTPVAKPKPIATVKKPVAPAKPVKKETPVDSLKNVLKGLTDAAKNVGKKKLKQAETTGEQVGKVLQDVGKKLPGIKVPTALKVDNKIGPHGYIDEVVEFASGLPGSMAESYGKSLEMLSTAKGREEIKNGVKNLPDTIGKTKDHITNKRFAEAFNEFFSNPATTVALDVSDFIPVLGVGSIAVKQGIKKGTKQAFKQVVKEAVEEAEQKGAKAVLEVGAKETKKVLVTKTSKAVQESIAQNLQKIGGISNNPNEYVKNLDSYVKSTLTKIGDDKEALSGLRTAVNKEMFGIAGIDPNGFKKSYAELMSVKNQDPEMGPVVARMESIVAEIDDRLISNLRGQRDTFGGASITEPSSKSSFKDASDVEASLVDPSGSTNLTSGVSKSTQNTLSSNRTNFLKDFDMKAPSESDYSNYYKVMQEVKPKFENTLDEIANDSKSTFIYREKTPESLAQKKLRKKDKVLGDMNDTLAGTIISANPDQAIETAIKRGVKITTDYRKEPTFLGYRGVHGDVELPNGAIGEIQFNTREGLYKKEYAHQIYDKWRDYIEYNGATTINDVLKRIPQDKYSEFLGDVAKSVDIYDGKVAIPQDFINTVEENISKQILDSQVYGNKASLTREDKIFESLKDTFPSSSNEINLRQLKSSDYIYKTVKTNSINDNAWSNTIFPFQREKIDKFKKLIQNKEDLPPVLLNEAGALYDGHHRLQAYKELGIDEIPILISKEAGKGSGKISFEDTIDRTQLSGKQLSMTNEELLRLQDANRASLTENKPDVQDGVNIPRAEISAKQPEIKAGKDQTKDTSSPNQYYKETPETANAIEQTAKRNNEPPGTVRKVLNKVGETKTKLIEYVQNEQERVRQLVSKKGVKVDDVSDPYLKATLYPGRVAEKIKQGNDEAEGLIKDMKKVADEFKTDLAGIREEVNNYLYFRHAPERNAALGDNAAGITTDIAEQSLKALGDRPHGEKVKQLADRAQKLNEQVLDLLHNSEVITDDTFDTLRNKYKNHVPLNRLFDETEDVGSVISGKGFDVRSTGIKRAKGSEREVDDILENIIINYQQAVVRSEKNIVDQATLAFVRNNEDLFGKLFQVTHPKPIGEGFGGQILREKTQDPRILQLFEKGKPTWIKINDLNLAIAFRAVGKEKLGGLMNAVASFTRFYSGLATRFNPEFAGPNKLRDLQETAVYLASQKKVGFAGATKTVARDLAQQNTKAVLDYIRKADTEGARLYKELKELGGTTGGFGLSTKESVSMNIEQLEKLANSKTRRVADNLVRYVDYWNTVFEDSTRLSVYRQGLKQGLSKERAAFLAKEASINFNRMGKGGPVINALYMFSNASIQGSTKMIRALRNPKVLGATVLTVGTSVAAVHQWNDKVDPEWRDKVTKWDRLNGLTIALPTPDGEGIKYMTIPVSWGLKPIKVMTEYVLESLNGNGFDVKKFAENIGTSILEAYNPTGGTDLWSALTPTALDLPSEIARNQSWSGSKIRPDFDKDAPDDIQYFESLRDTKTGQTAISITEMLQSTADISMSPANLKYAFEGYVGGAGRAISKTVNTITGILGNEPAPIDEYPFISRFYRERSQEEVEQGGGLPEKTEEEIDTILQDQDRTKFKTKERIKPIYEKVQGLLGNGKDDQAQEIVDGLSDDDYEIYKNLKTSDKRNKTTQRTEAMRPTVLEIQKLKKAGELDRVQDMVDSMTEEEYESYKKAKEQLGFK